MADLMVKLWKWANSSVKYGKVCGRKDGCLPIVMLMFKDDGLRLIFGVSD